MSIPYIQLLPTVFVRADVFPGLQAAQAGLNTLYGQPTGFSATEWDDEPTRPDRVIPAGLQRQLQAARPVADLPSHIERELADRYDVEPREMRQLKSWMETRNLRAGHFTKAVEYLSQMRLAAYEESFDNEPTVKIDIRQVQKDARKKENRHGIVRQAPL